MPKKTGGSFHPGFRCTNISRMKKLYFLLTLISVALCFAASAQFTKYSNEFLNIGAGVQATSMGNAQVASVTDGTAGYWNPAALTYVKDNPQVNLMHAEYFAGIGKYDYANLVLPLKNNKRVLALTLLRFAVDDIPNTIFLVRPDGTINFSNITISSADYAFLLSLAQQVKATENTNISLGMNAKIIHRIAGDFASAWGFGFDAGALIAGKRWKLGIMAKDVTTTFNAWSYSIDEQMREVFYVTDNDIPVKALTELTAPQLVLGAVIYVQKSTGRLVRA